MKNRRLWSVYWKHKKPPKNKLSTQQNSVCCISYKPFYYINLMLKIHVLKQETRNWSFYFRGQTARCQLHLVCKTWNCQPNEPKLICYLDHSRSVNIAELNRFFKGKRKYLYIVRKKYLSSRILCNVVIGQNGLHSSELTRDAIPFIKVRPIDQKFYSPVARSIH